MQFLQYFLKVPLFINLSKPEGNITQSTLRMIFVLWGGGYLLFNYRYLCLEVFSYMRRHSQPLCMASTCVFQPCRRWGVSRQGWWKLCVRNTSPFSPLTRLLAAQCWGLRVHHSPRVCEDTRPVRRHWQHWRNRSVVQIAVQRVALLCGIPHLKFFLWVGELIALQF